jgi:hypothetical protein
MSNITHSTPANKPRTRGKKHAGKKGKGYIKAALIIGTTALYVLLSASGGMDEWYEYAYFNFAMSGNWGLILKWVNVCILLPILGLLASISVALELWDGKERDEQ